MKKQAWSFLVAILISFAGIAQPYKPLLDNLDEWHFTTCFSGCNTSVYYTDGDTLMDGEMYKILDGYHYISRTFLLREDTANRKVYMATIGAVKTDVYLLYDFSVGEGDSMELFNPVSPFVTHAGFFQVDSIRLRTLEDGNAYRHFYWSPAPGNTTFSSHPIWVEGMGSLSLINAAAGEPDFSGVGRLNCFFKNSDTFYADLDSIDACEPVYMLGLDEPGEASWSLSPNPSPDFIQITGLKKETGFEIISCMGELVLRGKIQNEFPVDISSLENGTYFIRLDDHYLRFVKEGR